MIGTIEFVRCAGSLATSEYPVLESGADYSSYVVQSYSNCKYVEDIQQRIIMPTFDGWSSCNMVHLENVGWYWITDAKKSSIADNATEFALEFNAPMTMLSMGMTIKGQWLRSPVDISPWKQQAVISSAMEASSFELFPWILGEYNRYRDSGVVVGWVQVTISAGIAYDSDNAPSGFENGRLTRIAFPVAMEASSTTITDIAIADSDGYNFPPLLTFINDPTIIGLPDSTIIQDISFSMDCPYTYTATTPAVGDMTFGISGETAVRLKNNASSSSYHVYVLDGDNRAITSPLIRTITHTVTEQESKCGSIVIRDSNGSDIATMPTAWFDGSITVKVQTLSDFTGLYRDIYIQTTNRQNTVAVYRMPCTHLPYIGTQWSTYQAYSQSFDRESMNYSIQTADTTLNVQTNAQIANAAISAAAGAAASATFFGAGQGMTLLASAAQTAVNVSTNYRLNELQDDSTRFNQSLSERRIQAQPATVYSNGYGLNYIFNCLRIGEGIVIKTPCDLTDDIYNAYISNFGYSNEGEYSMTVQEGFYQGSVYSTTELTGPRFDELIKAFNNGFHIISMEGRT